MNGRKVIYSADFETTTEADDCRVWAWAICNIEDPENTVRYDNNLDSFMEYTRNNGGIYYFHNLKFDGNFILYWLFKRGYIWVDKKSKDLGVCEMCTLISDMGSWYTISIRMAPTETGTSNLVEIRDSLKLIPLPVEEIPKAYGLEDKKLKINYTEKREIGHELTQQEIDYVTADILIVAKAISFMRKNGQIKLTAASNALFDFRKRYSTKEYNKLFPPLNPIADADIRKSYKGGWTYLNPRYRNRAVKRGKVYDVNSMYPWAMKYCMLPWGDPYYFSGKYKPTKNYPLYIQCFVTEFKLKPGHYPSIQVKGSKLGYGENEYIVKSLAPTELTLTSVDFELFKENYEWDEKNTEWIGGYMFKGKIGMFTEYVDYWFSVKTESKKTGNKGMEKIAKLMLNSLYGKFGARMFGYSKHPEYNPYLDKVQYKIARDEAGNKILETRKGGYLPVATFITSYCRDKIIRAANACGDRFIYADTDSVHIEGNVEPTGIDIDKYRLGAFKWEEDFIRARFIRQKTYLEVYVENGKEKVNLKCCGMPESLKRVVTEDDFIEGASYDPSYVAKKNKELALDKDKIGKPKLMPEIVPGGVILKETTFQIKKAKSLPDVDFILG